MNLSQVYAIMGWPLRFWRTKTLPPQPVAHNIPFKDAMWIAGVPTTPEDSIGNIWQWQEGRKKDPLQLKETEKAKITKRLEIQTAMDIRYNSLKAGERLGKVTPDEYRELACMETGHGWCLDLSYRRREREGQRTAYFS